MVEVNIPRASSDLTVRALSALTRGCSPWGKGSIVVMPTPARGLGLGWTQRAKTESLQNIMKKLHSLNYMGKEIMYM